MTSHSLSAADIQNVVTTFYARVRKHPVLGPIFLDRIPDEGDNWSVHEAKIVEFWSSVILKTRSFHGNPMRTHAQVGAIKPEHFAIWLNLFDQVLSECLPSDHARAFSELAHRIGRSLRMGLAQSQMQQQMPNLTD